MKKSKGTKGDKPRKAIARFKTLWLKDINGVSKRLVVPKPDAPNTQLKESTKNLMAAYPNSYEGLSEGVSPTSPVRKDKPKAEVIPITRAFGKVKALINAEAMTYSRWAARNQSPVNSKDGLKVSSGEADAMVTLELRRINSGKRGHDLREEKAVTSGSVKDNTEVSVCPPPSDVTACNKVGYPPSVPTKQQLEIMSRNNPNYSPTVADIKWYINHVPPENWPEVVKENTYYANGEWKPDKGKLMSNVGMSIASQYDAVEQDYADLSRENSKVIEAYLELENDYHVLQTQKHVAAVEAASKIEHLNKQVAMLSKELALAKQASSLEGMHYAHTYEADVITLQEDNCYLKREIQQFHKELSDAHDEIDRLMQHVKSDVKPSHDIKSLAFEFKVYKSLHDSDPLRSFIRSKGLDLTVEKQLRDLFDKECSTRLFVSEERKVYRKWAGDKVFHTPRKAVRLKAELRALRRIQSNHVTVCNPVLKHKLQLLKERRVYKGWASRTSQPMCFRRINYYQWWVDNLTPKQAKAMELMVTKTYKFLKKTKDILFMEVNPWEIKKQRDKAKAKARIKRQAIKAYKVECSRIKEKLEQDYEAKQQRDHLRKMYGIAH